MADENMSAPPADDTQPLSTATVTESREIVVDPNVERASVSLGKALDEAFAKKEREVSERDEPEKPRKQTREKAPKEPETPKEEKKVESTPPEATEKDDSDPRKLIRKMIEDEGKGSEEEAPEATETPEDSEEGVEIPEGVKSKKAQDRFIELSRRVKQAETEKAELAKAKSDYEAKIKDLESRKPEGIPEEEKAKLAAMENELLQFRRQYQLDNDPAIKDRFEKPVVESEQTIAATLKRYGLTPEWEKVIEGEGGFAAFANSQKPAKSADGETYTFQQMAKDWIQSLSITDARAIESAMDEQIRTKNAKRRFIEEDKGKAKEWFDSQQKTYQASVEQQQKSQQEQRQKIDSFLSKATTQTEWMRDVEIPATASAEEKTRLTQENKFRSGLRNVLKATLEVKTLDELLDAALDATGYLYERRENARLAKENKELKARVTKMQGGSSTTPKSGSIASPKGETKKRIPDNMSAADAFERTLEAMASGG